MTDVTTGSEIEIAAARGLSVAEPRDYWQLLKPRVMSLVVFTAWVGLLLAPGHVHPLIGAISILCIGVGAGASGALNMWYDADIDAVMSRTRTRPIPAGKVTPDEALAFGLVLAAFSVMLLGIATNWLAAGLLAFTIFFYVAIYTMWLKRLTPQNIVIGGAAGAFPPMIAWAAATGAVSIESIVLFLIIFMWTPPHFWALAILKTEDYARAGVPMLPVVAGDRATRQQILVYSVLLAPIGCLPTILGFASLAYGAVAAVAGLAFVGYAVDLIRKAGGPLARKASGRLFGYSILYLFLLYAVLALDHVIRGLVS